MDFNSFYISRNGNECRPQVSYLLVYFTCDVNITSLSRSWHWWAATASAACVAMLEAVADWWCSWATMANMLVCLCLYQWWTFWTYLVTANLFSLYLMNFMFHTTLDAVGNILRVHYKSMKCNVSFSQGSISTLLRWGEHVSHVCKTLPAYSSAKIIKMKRVFSEFMITSVLPHFLMKHSVVYDWPIKSTSHEALYRMAEDTWRSIPFSFLAKCRSLLQDSGRKKMRAKVLLQYSCSFIS